MFLSSSRTLLPSAAAPRRAASGGSGSRSSTAGSTGAVASSAAARPAAAAAALAPSACPHQGHQHHQQLAPARTDRRAVLLHARRSTAAGEPSDGSESPAPAGAKRKGRKKKTDVQQQQEVDEAALEAAEAAADEAAAVEGPVVTWADDVGEENRRRFPFHRRLHTAAAEGNVASAELAVSAMQAADLEPGPRAYHMLLCAYLKAGDTPGALGVVGRATDAGIQLLPESYAVLIFAALPPPPSAASGTAPAALSSSSSSGSSGGAGPDHEQQQQQQQQQQGVDLAMAKSVYAALSGTDTDRQLPWATLCRLLAARGFAADAVAAVREGLRAGLTLDLDVAEAYVKALCDTCQSDAAFSFLEAMGPKHGLKPQARHVTAVVAAEAATGSLEDASSLVDAAGNRGWGRSAATFNALLAGIVAAMTPDDRGSEEQQRLSTTFAAMTTRMVQSGVRPTKFTFKLEAEGYIKLGDARSAMGSVRSLRTAAGAGGMRLLDSGSLSALLQLLSDRDMPLDLLQLLVYMSEDGCRMPEGALAPDAEGRTPLDAWLVGHMDSLAARAEQAKAAAALMEAPIEYAGDVPLGPGKCAVDETGRVVPLAKCTIKQLRAEAEARGVAGVRDMKKPELLAIVKSARARLPFNVLTAQVKGTVITPPPGPKKKPKAAAAPKAKKRSARQPVREVWSINTLTGDVEILPAPPDSAFKTEAEKLLLPEAALDEIDLTDDAYVLASNKAIKDIDFDALLEARMLDEGTAAVMNVGDEDVVSGFATMLPGSADEDEDDAADDEEDGGAGSGAGGGAGGGGARGRPGSELDEAAWAKMQSFERRSVDPQTLQEGYRQLQFLEAQQVDTDEANLVAGMDVAMDIIRAAEIVGGSATPADLLTLCAGALAERNANAAADVAPRLAAVLLAPGQPYDSASVLGQYEALADMCLTQAALQQADVVLEAAEAAGLTPSRGVLQRLAAALKGQPRRSERLGQENAALLQKAGLEGMEDLNPTDGQQQQQQQQQLPAAAAAAPAAAEVTVEALPPQEGDEDDDMPEELKEMLPMLEGILAWSGNQDKLRAALQQTGMSEERILEVMASPAALMADTSWLPLMLMADAADADEDGEDEDAAADEADDGASSSSAFGGMSLMQLAKAAAEGTLTLEQTNELLDAADEAGLPLLFDEDAQQILWPGTPEYESWARDAPEEAAQDDAVISAAFEEAFGVEMAEAEQAGVALEAELAGDRSGLSWSNPDTRQRLSWKAQYEATLAELGLAPDSPLPPQQPDGSSPEDVAAAKEALLESLHGEVAALLAERREDLEAAFKQMGLPVPDLSFDGSSSSSSGGGDAGGGGSTKQLSAGGSGGRRSRS